MSRKLLKGRLFKGEYTEAGLRATIISAMITQDLADLTGDVLMAALMQVDPR